MKTFFNLSQRGQIRRLRKLANTALQRKNNILMRDVFFKHRHSVGIHPFLG